MPHGVPLVVVFLSRLAGILVLSERRASTQRNQRESSDKHLHDTSPCYGRSSVGCYNREADASALQSLCVNVTCLQYRENVGPLPICIVCIALIYRAVLSRCGLSANANARNDAQLQTVMAAASALPVTHRSAF